MSDLFKPHKKEIRNWERQTFTLIPGFLLPEMFPTMATRCQ